MPHGLGETYEIPDKYRNVKFKASTVNKVTLKSINIEVRFWFNKTEGIEQEKGIKKIFKHCKKVLTFNGGGFYDIDKIISIADYPEDLTIKTEKCFVMFEFTIFPVVYLQNKIQTTYLLNQITDNIYQEVFEGLSHITKSKN